MRAPKMIARAALGALFLAAAAALPAAAQTLGTDDFKIDQRLTGVFTVAGKQVPLPAGDWRVAGYRKVTIETGLINYGAYGVIHNIVLFKTSGSTVDALLDLNVNALPVNDGWGISKDCERQDFYATIARYKSGWDASCLFLYHTQTATTDKTSRAWSDAMTYAKDKKLTLPLSWVTAGFRVATRSDVVDARFSFNPETRGMKASNGAWDQSPWHKTRFEADPAKVAFIAALATWAGPYAQNIEEGMKNRLLVKDGYPMPFANAKAEDKNIAARLKTLDKLYAEKAVTEEDYKAQREAIASGKADEPIPQPDAPTIAFWKTVAYRPMVSTANIFIDYYWVGSPFATGVLVILQILVNTTKFYFHEVAWERFVGAGSGKRDAPRTIDFTYAAVNS
jgi:uncharacterized membrane protein